MLLPYFDRLGLDPATGPDPVRLASGFHGQSAPPAIPAPYTEVCIHDRFEAAAARYPEGLAVSFEGESLTYADLARRARQTATLLRRYGVGPEVRLGARLAQTLDQMCPVTWTFEVGELNRQQLPQRWLGVTARANPRIPRGPRSAAR